MAKKIVWTKRAIFKLDKIIAFLEEEWGENVATAFVKRAYQIIELIAEQPALGSIEEPEKKISGFLITKHNRVFYRETDNEIIILNFFDTRSGNKRAKY